MTQISPTASTSRPYRNGDLPALLDFVSKNACRWPRNFGYLTGGDVAWLLPGSEPEANIRLWWAETGLLAYAWFEPATGFEFDLPGGRHWDPDLADEILDWAKRCRMGYSPAYPRFIDLNNMSEWEAEIRAPKPADPSRGYCLTTTALESDGERCGWLKANGFEPTRHWAPVYYRDLDDPLPEKLENLVLRHATTADSAERVATHRDAWLRSSFDLTRYDAVRATPPYDQELDIVLETTDGKFASYCICWADPVTRVGYFEPVGTRPARRGQGAGSAVIYEGLRRLRNRDMRLARVSTAGFNKPAQLLYESCGFCLHDVSRTYVLVVEA